MGATSSFQEEAALMSALIGEPTGARLVRPEALAWKERAKLAASFDDPTGAVLVAAGMRPASHRRAAVGWTLGGLTLLVVSAVAWQLPGPSAPAAALVVAPSPVEQAPDASPIEQPIARLEPARAVPASPRSTPRAAAAARPELELASSVYADAGKRESRIQLSGATMLGERLGADGLSDAAIARIVGDNKTSIARCVSEASRRGESWSGTMAVDLEINPTGAVRAASISTEELAGSLLAACAVRALGRWKFPHFEGAAARVSFPYEVAAIR